MKRFALIVALACLATTAHAGEILIKVNTHNSALERWTAEEFANAKPIALPRVHDFQPVVPQEVPPGDFLKETFGSEAEEPTLPDEACYALRRTLFEYQPAAMTAPVETPQSELMDVPLKNYGTAGLDYTSSRLIPSSAVETFPHRAVGKLFFNDSAGVGTQPGFQGAQAAGLLQSERQLLSTETTRVGRTIVRGQRWLTAHPAGAAAATGVCHRNQGPEKGGLWS